MKFFLPLIILLLTPIIAMSESENERSDENVSINIRIGGGIRLSVDSRALPENSTILPELISNDNKLLGRWARVSPFDPNKYIDSNRGIGAFNLHSLAFFEYGEGRIGKILRYNEEDKRLNQPSYRIENNTGKWTYKGEFRWELTKYSNDPDWYGSIKITDTAHSYFLIKEAYRDIIMIKYAYLSNGKLRARGSLYFLIRIGSHLYNEVFSFYECVGSNKGKKLYELNECKKPNFPQ